MKILLTGFNPFGKLESNPSQLVVEHFARQGLERGSMELIAEVLPTEFAKAGRTITRLIRQHRPGLIICLGVAQGIEEIHLERVAFNLDDTKSPDNAGQVYRGKRIAATAPLAYWSTLPLERMVATLKRRRIPVAISNHAGTYVCNHVFFLARHEVERAGIRSHCGFIHLPAIRTRAKRGSPAQRGLPLKTMVKGIESCLKIASESHAL